MPIIGLTSSIAGLFRRNPPLDAETRAALAHVIEVIGPLMASVSGFERRLVPPVQAALKYCDQMVAALPAGIEINRRAFALDPRVHAFFSTVQDIDEMLGRSQTLRDFLANPSSSGLDHCHALFAARRREKRVIGVALQGEVLRQDVPQTLLYFSAQTLTAVAPDLQATRSMLSVAAFDSLLKSFTAQVEAIRLDRQGLQRELDLERVRLKGLHGSLEPSALAARRQTLTGLELGAVNTAHSLQPDQLVAALVSFLNQPSQALRLESVRVRVDRNGVIAAGLDKLGDQDDDLCFPELVGRDRRRYVVMLASIARDEAERAVAKILDQQRRFILI